MLSKPDNLGSGVEERSGGCQHDPSQLGSAGYDARWAWLSHCSTTTRDTFELFCTLIRQTHDASNLGIGFDHVSVDLVATRRTELSFPNSKPSQSGRLE